jgi:hypothetical protein
MLPPDGESERFLTTKDLKLVGHRRGKFVFCYVVHRGPYVIFIKAKFGKQIEVTRSCRIQTGLGLSEKVGCSLKENFYKKTL